MTYSWWQHGIIYQIYPRSFADSNGDGIGDLNGITSRLDYLANLGVDAVWISPVFPSPDVDFGYDVSDYCAIDPKFGDLADFDRLVKEAHARDIHIILDLVLNHTSDQHTWFIESRRSRANPFRDWYIWADPRPDGRPPNNWQSEFGGPGWTLDRETGQYYFHMFYPEQPDLNWHNPRVQEAMLDVFRFWLDRGVDGFRLDVFNVYFKHPDLLDNPPALGLRGFDRIKHIYDCDQPELKAALMKIRALLDEYALRSGVPRYVVGETFLSSPEKAASYCGPNLLHAAFNFETLSSPFHAGRLMEIARRWEHALGPDGWPNYVLNNHDAPRLATRWQAPPWSRWLERPLPDARLKVGAALLLTLRGTPFLYYGEEIGMSDIPIPSKEDVLDPIGRRYWPIYKGRDGCRSPMQWDDSPEAGFTKPGVRPWLPVHAGAASRSIKSQYADPHSLFNFYRQLIELRRASPALHRGMFQPVTYGTRSLAAYLRQTADETVLVALNFSHFRQRLVFGRQLAHSELKLLLSSSPRRTLDRPRSDLLVLEPFEALIIAVR